MGPQWAPLSIPAQLLGKDDGSSSINRTYALITSRCIFHTWKKKELTIRIGHRRWWMRFLDQPSYKHRLPCLSTLGNRIWEQMPLGWLIGLACWALDACRHLCTPSMAEWVLLGWRKYLRREEIRGFWGLLVVLGYPLEIAPNTIPPDYQIPYIVGCSVCTESTHILLNILNYL
jgi:hypothetical protein